MIKYIHCFGTSYTAGGGHEFDGITNDRNVNSKTSDYVRDLMYFYKKKYPNEEQTRFNCSWPGQLQKLVNDKIIVLNHAKSGYGNDRMMRITNNIVNDIPCKYLLNDEFNYWNFFEKEEHFFLFEFAGLGRKELFSNTLNDFIVTNYNLTDKNTFEYNGAANNYFYDDVEKTRILDSLSDDIIEPFYKEFLNIKPQMDKLIMMDNFFLSFLKEKKLNFMFTQQPSHFDQNMFDSSHHINYSSSTPNFVDYFNDRNLTIEKDTEGRCNDGHMGMTGAKEISSIIHNHLVKSGYLK